MPVYINRKVNHSPTIIKEISKAIAKWISDISSSEVVFNKSIPIYSDVLRKSGFYNNITFIPKTTNTKTNKKKSRNHKSYGSILHIALVSKQMSEEYSENSLKTFSKS